MEETKYIFIKNKNNKLEKRRILVIYQMEDKKKDYVIYYDDRIENNKEYFVASYDSNKKNINHNLSEIELEYAKKILEYLKNKE